LHLINNNQNKLIMKRTLLAVAMAACAFGAQAQKQNAIKANLFSPLAKSGSFFYERKVADNKSAQLGVGFTAYSKDGVKLSGIFFTPEFRFYLSGEAMNGFYVGPFARYQSLKIEDKSSEEYGGTADKATLTTIGGGVVVGRQWMFGDIVTLDIFGGPSLNSGTVKYDDGAGNTTIPGNFSGFGARVGITLGIAF
jgi:hypothetical protein